LPFICPHTVIHIIGFYYFDISSWGEKMFKTKLWGIGAADVAVLGVYIVFGGSTASDVAKEQRLTEVPEAFRWMILRPMKHE
jgi:hypothetical protein